MQTSRAKKKGPELTKEFSKIIKDAVLHVNRYNLPYSWLTIQSLLNSTFRDGGNVKKSILRLLDVWQERQVLTTPFIQDIRSAIEQDSQGKHMVANTASLNSSIAPQNNSSSSVPVPAALRMTPSSMVGVRMFSTYRFTCFQGSKSVG